MKKLFLCITAVKIFIITSSPDDNYFNAFSNSAIAVNIIGVM
ncbi:hypothetical protein [Leminorella grimontii]|nr:hypothetical protein [Leminorella grimontii]KFC95712.1 hypothetical protein GLGR_1875 [Leminorella grimontii ATCC 33999 = DSM 5078]